MKDLGPSMLHLQMEPRELELMGKRNTGAKGLRVYQDLEGNPV